MIKAGVAVVDVTPDSGLLMAGFAARTKPAECAHDRLTVRALAINDTALVVADVIGFHHEMSARIRDRCPFAAQNVMICATHTHGGPVSMAGRLHAAADPGYLTRLENSCVLAIEKALADQAPSTLTYAEGTDPDVARNRRHADGPIDRALPVLRVHGQDGTLRAILVNYACHPVVLGAHNRQWTGDYPHYVRANLEQTHPGATAIFLTGCIGDLNTGHSAEASITLDVPSERTFEAAETIGEKIATAALDGVEQTLGASTAQAETSVDLTFERRETAPLETLRHDWLEEAARSSEARATLLRIWADWARDIAPRTPTPQSERVALLNWGGLQIIGMPGEIFASIALDLRAALAGKPVMLAGFCEDNPGYIPPKQEYQYGGYEVEEAHRFYGQSATVAPGCAEAIRDAAFRLAGV
ncbi:MAG: neutral/alkaline non-lysosomal ceramidase N-terminal domain-containing protein [Pseudomonadota bacterium]